MKIPGDPIHADDLNLRTEFQPASITAASEGNIKLETKLAFKKI